MKLTNVEKKEKNQVVLSITVEADVFEAACEKSYRKNAHSINIQGFRKGKAPRKIIEKLYGPEIFYDDAMNACIPDAYEAAVEEAGLKVVSQPSITDVDVKDGEFVFTAVVYVKPEVSVKDYKGIEAEKDEAVVTAEEVEAELTRMQDRNARQVSVEREAKKGDIVNLDFEGFVDGVAFEGGKGEKFPLELGSGSFIPGFEDQIVGKNIGDELDVNVTFPEHYQAENLAGKPAVFKCKLHELKGKELPAVDDDFAKDVSEFDTIDEYKADIKSKLEKAAADEADTNLDNALVDALVSKMKAEVPQVMYQRRIDDIVREWSARNRIRVEDYLKYVGQTMDQFRANFTEVAKRQVDLRLALEKIAEIENVQVSDEDIEKEYADMAEQYKMEADKVKAAVPVDAIKNDLRIEKALDLVRNSAKIEEVTE